MLPVVPEPTVLTEPGILKTLQLPAGRLLKATLPVVTAQVGCVIVPTIGAAVVLIIMVIPVLVAVDGLTQIPPGVSIQSTTWLLVRLEVVNVFEEPD
jgi:hypothetical protein